MKRRDYSRPAMLVVRVQATRMLADSGVSASRSGYGTADEQTWGDGGGAGANARGNYVDWDNN